MNIGIDARPLIGNKSGIGNYLEQILRVWAKSSKQNDYYLFAHKDFNLPSELRSIGKIVLPLKPGTIWVQTAIPYLLDRYNIDLFWGPNYSIPLIRPKKTKAVITVHDMVSFVYPETLPAKTVIHNRFGLPMYLHHADYVITESESTKRDILRFLDYPHSRVDITLLGVNQRFFQNISERDQILRKHDIDFPYILSVGTIEPRKNLIGVIQAFFRLLKGHTVEHRLVVVGANGWKYSAVYELLESHPELKERIYFLGYVPDEDLPALYQGASLFVYPSFYEGFGLPPLEAMASGVPVIASNVSSIPEVVGDAGLLVNPYSIDEMANAIERILTNQELAYTLSKTGLERARTFTWDRTAKQTLSIFEKIMNEKEEIKWD